MKVLSVNISQPKSITINDKKELTGYFKTPVESIHLGKANVKNDCVIDGEHHGGNDKACYLFGNNHYEFWRNKYSHLQFEFGMFGENITVENLDESTLKIGDTFKIGEAIIQITQPRQPCYKMGIKFNNPEVVNEFRLAHTPGMYVRVLKEGSVKVNDELLLTFTNTDSPTVLNVYRMIYDKKPNKTELTKIVNNAHLAERLKQYLINKFKL